MSRAPTEVDFQLTILETRLKWTISNCEAQNSFEREVREKEKVELEGCEIKEEEMKKLKSKN